jgi:O-antigen/teichoic acid export membrane protein
MIQATSRNVPGNAAHSGPQTNPKRLATKLKTLLNPRSLRSLITNVHADHGRERYRRITASTSFLSKALTIVISFASVPLTVHYLGAERYGVWLVISSLLTWMSLTDFGLAGNALVNVIAEASGKDDRQLAQQYSASAFWALAAISIALGVTFLGTFHLVPWRSVFQVSSAVRTQELEQACAITLALFVFGLPLNMVASVYNAYQDGFVSNIWSIASNALALISLILVTQIRGGLPLLVIALSGTRMSIVMANGVYAFARRYPWLSPRPSAVRWLCVKRLLTLGGKYMVTQLAALGISQSQPMIITQLLGPSKVTIFVIACRVVTLPLDLTYMATVPFISAFSEAKSRGDWRWIKNGYKNSTIASVAIGVPVAAAVAFIARPLIRVWAGPAALPDFSLIVWLSIYTLVGVAMMSAGQMLAGLERLNQLALSAALCALAVVGFAILLAPRWGLSGIALGMAASKLLTFWPIQVYETRRILRMANSPVEGLESHLVPSVPGDSATDA